LDLLTTTPWYTPSGVYAGHTIYLYETMDVCRPIFGCVKQEKYRLGLCVAPQNGGDAYKPGTEGKGGNGGVFISNIDPSKFSINVSLLPGKNGQPRPIQPGGIKGYPSPAYCLRKNNGSVWTETTYTSVDGKSASPDKNFNISNPGQILLKGHEFSWLRPELMFPVLEYIKDTYLNSRNTVEAKIMIDEYLDYLNKYENKNEWNELPTRDKASLSSVKSQMSALKYQIEHNMDYFGNLPGWVPMLSFEALTELFTKEVDSSIHILYLQYWLGNKGKSLIDNKQFLIQAREQAVALIENNQKEYKKAVNLIDEDLKVRVEKIELDTNQAINKLKSIEDDLRRIAEDNAKAKEKKDNMIRGVRMVASALKMVPIPIVQGISMGMDVLASIADQPSGDPWQQIKGLNDVTSAFKEGYNSTAATDKRKQWDDTIDKINLASKNFDVSSIDSMKNSLLAMNGSIDNARKFMQPISDLQNLSKPIKVSREEVSSIVAQLETESPSYQKTYKEIQDLLQRKQMMIEDINKTTILINQLQNAIIQASIAVDKFSEQLATNNKALDLEALNILDGMGRDAKERLLRYHYYLAKAYQYRLVKTYPNSLDLQRVFDKMLEIAKAPQTQNTQNPIISDTEFQSIKSVYTDQLRKIVSDVLGNIDLSETQTTTSYTLSPKQLSRLSKEGHIRINLYKPTSFIQEGFFSFYENIRIVDMNIKVSDNSGIPFNLSVTHSGISNIEDEGVLYSFDHYSQKNNSAISWGVDYRNGITNTVKPSISNESLIRNLVGSGDPKMMLFSLPGAWAEYDLNINKETDKQIALKNVVLEINYARQTANSEKSGIIVSSIDNSTSDGDDVAPHFLVTPRDLNNRADGIDFFKRFYQAGTSVDIEAPKNIGNKKFIKWVDGAGDDITSNNVIHVKTGNSNILMRKAIYDLDTDYDSDQDRIPDLWEIEHGLDPKNPIDGSKDSIKSGTQNWKIYLWDTSIPPDLPNVLQKFCNVNISETTPNSRFFTQNDILIDSKTGLMWKKCMEGRSGNICEKGNAIVLNWQDALNKAKEVNENGGTQGYTDWRIPNIKELASILEERCGDPAINSDIFPNSPSEKFWTSSPSTSLLGNVWLIDFKDAHIDNDSKNKLYNLRLVRSGR